METVCYECRKPLDTEEAHSNPDGEDVHPECCVVCAEDLR